MEYNFYLNMFGAESGFADVPGSLSFVFFVFFLNSIITFYLKSTWVCLEEGIFKMILKKHLTILFQKNLFLNFQL